MAIKGPEKKSNILGIYLTWGGTDEKCSQENISIFLNENKKRSWVGVKANGTDVYDQYKVLMGTTIPDMAGVDKIMAQTMKVAVTEEVRSKNKVDHLLSKAPAVEKSSDVPTSSEEIKEGYSY